MKKKLNFIQQEQKIKAIIEFKHGAKAKDVARKYNVNLFTFYRWTEKARKQGAIIPKTKVRNS